MPSYPVRDRLSYTDENQVNKEINDSQEVTDGSPNPVHGRTSTNTKPRTSI
jgi:hypothetical protein